MLKIFCVYSGMLFDSFNVFITIYSVILHYLTRMAGNQDHLSDTNRNINIRKNLKYYINYRMQ